MRFNSKFLTVICLMLALILSVWLRPVSSSSLDESRISQLEVQVRSLQTQLNQLQGQLPRIGSSSPAPRPEFTQPANELSADEQFDNLATLVIEINQRVMKLEEKLSASVDE